MVDPCPDQPPRSLSDDDWEHWLPSAYPGAFSDCADTAAVASTTPQSQNDWGSLELFLSEHLENGKLPDPTGDASTNPPPDDSTNASAWLDGAYRPPVPCAYCQQHRLQCLIIRTTPANPNPVTSCSSCVALFRECSLARGEKRHPAGFETVFPVFNHLHGVTEWTEEELVSDPHAPPVSELQDDQVPAHFREMTKEEGQHKRRFSRKGAKILRDWFYQNQHAPYPTDGQKAAFSQQTGLTEKQISTWFANARRRSRMARRASHPGQIFRSGSPMPIARSAALTPMERWQRSPPDEEPVLESAIQQAIQQATGTDAVWNHPNISADASLSSSHLAFSISSIDSELSQASSESFSSAWSHQTESCPPFPLSEGRPRSHSRRRRPRGLSAAENMYQCTFCVDSFKKKHDWVRHEKSVHLSLASWICRVGSGILDPAGSEASSCEFCSASASPRTESHFSTHEFDVCADRPLSERSFRRKDHLIQHFRKFHHCTTIPAPRVEVCRVTTNEVRSRCGFCQLVMPTWAERADHLAEHFKNGQRMADWSGDWGLGPSYQAMLRDAILPANRPAYSEGVS